MMQMISTVITSNELIICVHVLATIFESGTVRGNTLTIRNPTCPPAENVRILVSLH